MERKNITEILHHMGETNLPAGAVSPPIFQTSIFSFDTFDDFQNAISDEVNSYIYTRGNNPTINILEEKLAALEHGEKAKVVSSGISAISASIMAFIESGDHIVSVRDVYSWTKTLLEEYLKRFDVDYSYVEGTDVEEIENAIQDNTKLIYLESPTTFSFQLQDLEAVAKLARAKGIKTVIDNTWATPIYQNPLDYGIDIAVHSASKYFGGNSDIVGGVIIGSEKDIHHIFKTEFQNLGTVPDPFMGWLMLRGIRTLHLRMPAHFQSTKKVIDFMSDHPLVEEVNYPFYPGNAQYELAKKQMSGGSGLFSFRLVTRDRENVKLFTDSLKYFRRAVSWGGYESLIMPYAVKSKDVPEEMVSLIRLHIGLEDSEMLIGDLEQALEQIKD